MEEKEKEIPMTIRIEHDGMFDATIHEMLRSALEARKKYIGLRCTSIEIVLKG